MEPTMKGRLFKPVDVFREIEDNCVVQNSKVIIRETEDTCIIRYRALKAYDQEKSCIPILEFIRKIITASVMSQK